MSELIRELSIRSYPIAVQAYSLGKPQRLCPQDGYDVKDGNKVFAPKPRGRTVEIANPLSHGLSLRNPRDSVPYDIEEEKVCDSFQPWFADRGVTLNCGQSDFI